MHVSRELESRFGWICNHDGWMPTYRHRRDREREFDHLDLSIVRRTGLISAIEESPNQGVKEGGRNRFEKIINSLT